MSEEEAANSSKAKRSHSKSAEMTHDEFLELLEERGRVVYILDQDLIRFGKFAGSLLALFVLAGAVLYGVDIKEMGKSVEDARADTEKSLRETQALKSQIETLYKDFQTTIDSLKGEATRNAATLQSVLASAATEVSAICANAAQNNPGIRCQQAVLVARAESSQSGGAANARVEIALISEVNELKRETLTKISSVLQKQVSNDLRPLWNVDASITVYGSLEAVPKNAWPVFIKRDAIPGSAAFHSDKNGTPYALATYTPKLDDLSLTLSHQILEMLVDPRGNRMISNPSPNPADNKKLTNILMQIADPVEAAENGYRIDDVLVSDFVTPTFYATPNANGSKFSFAGKAKEPLKILKGGYISYMFNDTKSWAQATWFDGASPQYQTLGKIASD